MQQCRPVLQRKLSFQLLLSAAAGVVYEALGAGLPFLARGLRGGPGGVLSARGEHPAAAPHGQAYYATTTHVRHSLRHTRGGVPAGARKRLPGENKAAVLGQSKGELGCASVPDCYDTIYRKVVDVGTLVLFSAFP